MRVVKQWKRLRGEVLESPSLEILKTCLGTVVDSLLELTLLEQVALNYMISRGSLRTQWFCLL